MTVTPDTFDYIAFVNDGFASQQKYAEVAGQLGPLDLLEPKDRYAKVIEMLGHMPVSYTHLTLPTIYSV